MNDHYNIVPVLSTFTISKYLGDNFSFGVTGSVNKIDKFGDAAVDDLTYFGADGTIKYNVGDALDWKKFQPYLGVGGGYTWVDDIGAGTINGTFGLNYWFSDQFGITAQSSYKHSFEDYLSKHSNTL